MSHWLVDSISAKRALALQTAEQFQLHQDLRYQGTDAEYAELEGVANALELATMDVLLERFEEDDTKLKLMREYASDAFSILRVLPLSDDSVSASYQLLRMSSLAVLGGCGAEASCLLTQIDWPVLPLDSDDWGERTWSTIIDVWLRLMRRKGLEDRDLVLQRIADLRNQQSTYEKKYLDGIDPAHSKTAALELVGLYHVAKAAGIMALFITDGVVEGNHRILQLLETHFDRALAVCEHARMIGFEPMTRFLKANSVVMLETTSVWQVGICKPEKGR